MLQRIGDSMQQTADACSQLQASGLLGQQTQTQTQTQLTEDDSVALMLRPNIRQRTENGERGFDRAATQDSEPRHDRAERRRMELCRQREAMRQLEFEQEARNGEGHAIPQTVETTASPVDLPMESVAGRNDALAAFAPLLPRPSP